MNPVTFNDPFITAAPALDQMFKEMEMSDSDLCRKLAHARKKSGLADSKHCLERLKCAPLFICNDTEPWSSSDNPLAFDRNGAPIFPFRDFRASITRLKDDGVLIKCDVFVFDNTPENPQSDKGFVKVMALMTSMEIPARTFSMMFRLREFSAYGEVGKGVGENVLLASVMIYPDGKFRTMVERIVGGNLMPPIEDEGDSVFTMFIQQAYASLCRLAIDCMNPNLQMVRVRKRNPSKSVEWHRAREHYIFIHKSSPVNKRGANKVKFDAEKERKRTAHSRRAHYRLLTHPKWKAKRGSFVLVKSCWVGPLEWEDATGQIYRIVDSEHARNLIGG